MLSAREQQTEAQAAFDEANRAYYELQAEIAGLEDTVGTQQALGRERDAELTQLAERLEELRTELEEEAGARERRKAHACRAGAGTRGGARGRGQACALDPNRPWTASRVGKRTGTRRKCAFSRCARSARCCCASGWPASCRCRKPRAGAVAKRPSNG